MAIAFLFCCFTRVSLATHVLRSHGLLNHRRVALWIVPEGLQALFAAEQVQRAAVSQTKAAIARNNLPLTQVGNRVDARHDRAVLIRVGQELLLFVLRREEVDLTLVLSTPARITLLPFHLFDERHGAIAIHGELRLLWLRLSSWCRRRWCRCRRSGGWRLLSKLLDGRLLCRRLRRGYVRWRSARRETALVRCLSWSDFIGAWSHRSETRSGRLLRCGLRCRLCSGSRIRGEARVTRSLRLARGNLLRCLWRDWRGVGRLSDHAGSRSRWAGTRIQLGGNLGQDTGVTILVLRTDHAVDDLSARSNDNVLGPAIDAKLFGNRWLVARIDLDWYEVLLDRLGEAGLRKDVRFQSSTRGAVVGIEVNQNQLILRGRNTLGGVQIGCPTNSVRGEDHRLKRQQQGDSSGTNN